MVIVPRNSGGREGTPPYSRVVIFMYYICVLWPKIMPIFMIAESADEEDCIFEMHLDYVIWNRNKHLK